MVDCAACTESPATSLVDLLARLESGHLVVAPTRLDVADLLADLRVRFLSNDAHAGKDLVARMHADSRPLTTDAGLLRAVLDELVSNALEASRVGERVTVRHVRDPHATSFAIHNPAVMDQATRIRIFERRPGGKGGGRGVGTFAARRLVEHHLGGHLRFGSNLEHGTVFVIDLPHQPWVRRGAQA